mgnify:CR=1 FL=1
MGINTVKARYEQDVPIIDTALNRATEVINELETRKQNLAANPANQEAISQISDQIQQVRDFQNRLAINYEEYKTRLTGHAGGINAVAEQQKRMKKAILSGKWGKAIVTHPVATVQSVGVFKKNKQDRIAETEEQHNKCHLIINRLYETIRGLDFRTPDFQPDIVRTAGGPQAGNRRPR